MRLGLQLRRGREAEDARVAEDHACAFVLVDADAGGAFVAGAAVAVATRHVRIVVPVHLGTDHPVTLAEDLAVLDNLSGGRVVGLVDTGGLTVEEAAEDLALLRASLGARPVRHRGARWNVPAGLDGHEAPESVHVTPKPAQIRLPLWLTGTAAVSLAHQAPHADPLLATSSEEVDADAPVQPAILGIGGTEASLDRDRDAIVALADAGATHLVLRAADPVAAAPLVSRFLIPEVAMTGFPRVVAEAMLPPAWPGPARYVTGQQFTAGSGAGEGQR
jgi:alkanesulfonate monooxygenase SsuD/methylene tetrahydromethanopterin reductase-like flavin-dependent oxidoreductase (luciferase family)